MAGREALVDSLAADIQARVLSGALPSGTRLRQEALASEFGVSRTPVREALRKLQESGLVELEPNRGAIVRMLTPREIRDAYEVRAELEALAAGLAARRIQQDQLERLRAAQAAFRDAFRRTATRRAEGGPATTAEDRASWGRANDAFHQGVHAACGNDVLSATLARLRRSVPRDLSRIVLGESTSVLADNVAEHEAIVAAIERRDEGEARRLMCEHVRRAGELVTLRVERRLGG